MHDIHTFTYVHVPVANCTNIIEIKLPKNSEEKCLARLRQRERLLISVEPRARENWIDTVMYVCACVRYVCEKEMQIAVLRLEDNGPAPRPTPDKGARRTRKDFWRHSGHTTRFRPAWPLFSFAFFLPPLRSFFSLLRPVFCSPFASTWLGSLAYTLASFSVVPASIPHWYQPAPEPNLLSYYWTT